MASPDPELRRWCLELMRESEAVYLTTLDADGFPCTRGMLNLRHEGRFPKLAALFASHEGDFVVYLTTNTSSEKVRQLLADGKASLYYCKPAEYNGVMLSGYVELVEEQSVKDRLWQEDWTMYYPKGRGDEDYAILRMRPMNARGWRGSGPFAFALNAGGPTARTD